MSSETEEKSVEQLVRERQARHNAGYVWCQDLECWRNLEVCRKCRWLMKCENKPR